MKDLSNANPTQQVPIIQALGRSGDTDAVPPILTAFDIRRASPRVTAACIEALGRLRDPRAVDALIAAWDYLNSVRLQTGPDFPGHLQTTRAALIEALGMIPEEKNSAILLEALGDQDALVVQRAAEALGRRRDKRAIEALISLIPRGGSFTQAAYEALGEIGDLKAVSAIERGLAAEDMVIRLQAAYALARIGRGDQDGQYFLTQTLANDKEHTRTRIMAAYYLARLGNAAGLQHLVMVMEKGGDSQKLQAIQALGKSGHKKAVIPLADAISTPDAQARMTIARALGQLGGARAVGALRRLTDDSNATVKVAARQALAELGEEQ